MAKLLEFVAAQPSSKGNTPWTTTMLPTEAVAHPRVRDLRGKSELSFESSASGGIDGLRLALAGLSRGLDKCERELALVKRKLRENANRIQRIELTLHLVENSLSYSEETRAEVVGKEEVGGAKRSVDTSEDFGRSRKRFKDNESISPISAKLSENCASGSKSPIKAPFSQSIFDDTKTVLKNQRKPIRATDEAGTVLTAADSRKEEPTAANLRNEVEKLGLLLLTEKRVLTEENELHADLSADLLGCLNEEQLADIGELVGHSDPRLLEVRGILKELRKFVERYPSDNAQKYVGDSFRTLRSSVGNRDSASFSSSDVSDTDSIDSDSEDSALSPSARFRKRRSAGNDLVELLTKKPRSGPAVVEQTSKCRLPETEWVQLQMYDRFRRMYN